VIETLKNYFARKYRDTAGQFGFKRLLNLRETM